VAGLLGGGIALTGAAAPAFAGINCGTVYPKDHQWFKWTHTNVAGSADVTGVRAGVKLRLDGANCNYVSGGDQNMSVWIAVVGDDSNHIAQLGFIKEYNGIGITQTCSFAEAPAGNSVHYDCTGKADDDGELFYIHLNNTHDKYVLDDCGKSTNTSDYSSCTPEHAQQTVWDHPHGEASEEEHHGACDAHTFGATSDHERIGGWGTSPLLPLQGIATSDQNWTARSWGNQGDNQDCLGSQNGSYNLQLKESNPSRGLEWWDTRNAG
jgi:hypothetical protein